MNCTTTIVGSARHDDRSCRCGRALRTSLDFVVRYCRHYHKDVNPRQNIWSDVFGKNFRPNVWPPIDFYMIMPTESKLLSLLHDVIREL